MWSGKRAVMLQISFVLLLASSLFVSSCSDSQNESKDNRSESAVKDENNDGDENLQDSVVSINEELLSEEDLVLLFEAFQTGKQTFDFYAVFTEPFWIFYFKGGQVLVQSLDMEIPQIASLESTFNPEEDEQILNVVLKDQVMKFKVVKGKGSDGMSDVLYPYSVQWEGLYGAGATALLKEE